MVLSKLCMNLAEQNTKQWKAEFYAFIVDHKARIGSHEEAHLVSSRLQKLGALFVRGKPSHLTDN